MWTLRSLFSGEIGALLAAAHVAAFAVVGAGCYDNEEISPVGTTSVSTGGSTGTSATGGSTVTASGGSTGTAGGGGMSTGGASTGGASTGGTGGTGGDTGTGGVLAQIVPDFSLIDMNAASATAGKAVSPRDYKSQVSAWYFGHST